MKSKTSFRFNLRFHAGAGILLGILLLIIFTFFKPPTFSFSFNTKIMGCSKQTCTDTNERIVLPSNVRPIHYDLELKPDMEKFVFDGIVSIR